MIRSTLLMTAVLFGWGDPAGSPASDTGKVSAPRGHLVIVGGGPAVEEIYRRTLELAGGPEARVLVVPFASPDPSAGERSAAIWQSVGATRISVLDLGDPQAAIESVRTADLIWFRGGEQQRLMRALGEVQGLVDAIRERYMQGATVGGTSAGAAVMSRLMIAGPAGRRGTPEANLPRFSDGLGLWPDVIVDQHFVRRRRHRRLEAAVMAHPDLLGIGIDEATAVIVNGRQFEVLGTGPVLIFDGRATATVTPPNGLAVGIAGVMPSRFNGCTLRSGMKFDLDHGLVIETVAER